jgi:hypothetical protein
MFYSPLNIPTRSCHHTVFTFGNTQAFGRDATTSKLVQRPKKTLICGPRGLEALTVHAQTYNTVPTPQVCTNLALEVLLLVPNVHPTLNCAP